MIAKEGKRVSSVPEEQTSGWYAESAMIKPPAERTVVHVYIRKVLQAARDMAAVCSTMAANSVA